MKYEYYDFSSNRSIAEAKKIFSQRMLDASNIYKKHESEFIKRNCPVCNSSDSKNVDYFYDMYGIDECETCSSLFVNPCPNIEALSDYYQNSLCNRQLSRVIKKRYDSDDFINDDRLVVIAESIKNIKNNTKTIKILEIGCNNGTFLSKLRQYCEQSYPDIEFELFGVDIDKTAINNSVDEELNLFCGLAEDITKEHKDEYDLIVHFELIEHLINPRLFVKSIHNMLVKGGKMVFTTPNIYGLDNQALSYNNTRYLAHSIFPPMHINAFSTMNITHFLISNGFGVNEITTPGKFDIDILSKCVDNLQDDVFKDIALLDRENKALLQQLMVRLNVSSHMQCVAFKK